MKKFFLAIAMIAFGTSAHAADVYTSIKDTPSVYKSETPATWTSLWAAALVGYHMSNTELSADIFDRERSFNIATIDGFGGEGFSGDVQLGGDVQLERFVLGAFGEYSFGGTQSEVSVFEGIGKLDVEQNDSYSILARAGVVSRDGNTLLYVAGGYTWTEAEVTLRLGDEAVHRSYDFSGIPLELGVEHKFGPNVRGRLAGRYTWLDKETVFREESEGYGSQLTAEPGILSIKAGVVISTSGGLPALN